MPFCRNCGARLNKFDSDLCPVCGTKKPFDGEMTEIDEQTQTVGYQTTYKFKSKKTLLALSFLCGFLGIPFFYLKTKKAGLIVLLASVLLGAVLFLPFIINNLLIPGIIILVSFLIAINIAIGIVFLVKRNLKDGNGEFVN